MGENGVVYLGGMMMKTRQAIWVWAGVVLAWAGGAWGELVGEKGMAREEGELNRQLELLLMAAPEEETGGYEAADLSELREDAGAFVAKMGLAVVGGTRGAVGEFTAADESTDTTYTKGEDWLGKNGGEGFEAWRAGSGSAVPDSRNVAADRGFYMQAGETAGEMAMVRDLEAGEGLVSGSFSLTMWGAAGGADEPGDFAGFAVYGANDRELFRWGWRLMEGDDPVDAFACSLDGGLTYAAIEWGYPSGGVEYLLTWDLVGGRTQVVLSAAGEGGSGSYFSGYTVSLGTAERVTAIAALLTESGTYAAGGDGSEMTFDHLRVTGTRGGAVPEPGVLGLLAVGIFSLARGARLKK